METDRPDSHPLARARIYSHRLSRVSSVAALAGLLAVAAGGYLTYQSSSGLDASSELQPKPVSPSPGAEDTTASSSPANAASDSQRVAADADAPTENLPNQGSQTPLPSLDSWRAGTLPQDQADGLAAPTNSGNATEPAAGFPENARSRPTSLPTNDIAYVQKSRANIRSEPSVDAKLVGHADKGSKLNVVKRAGKWTQVEHDATRGWVSGNLLGPRSP